LVATAAYQTTLTQRSNIAARNRGNENDSEQTEGLTQGGFIFQVAPLVEVANGDTSNGY